MGVNLVNKMSNFIDDNVLADNGALSMVKSAKKNSNTVIKKSYNSIANFANNIGKTANNIGYNIKQGAETFGNLLVEGYKEMSKSDFINYTAETVGSLIDKIDIEAFWKLYSEGITAIPGTAKNIWNEWIDFVSSSWDKTYWHYMISKGYTKTNITTGDSISDIAITYVNENLLDYIANSVDDFNRLSGYDNNMAHYNIDHFLFKVKNTDYYNRKTLFEIHSEYERIINATKVYNNENDLNCTDVYFKDIYNKLFDNIIDSNTVSNVRSITMELPLLQSTSKINSMLSKNEDKLFLAAMNNTLKFINVNMFFELFDNLLVKELANELKNINETSLSNEILKDDIPELNKNLKDLIRRIESGEISGSVPYDNVIRLYKLLNVVVNKNSFNFFDLTNYLNDDLLLKILKKYSEGTDLYSIRCRQFFSLFPTGSSVMTNFRTRIIAELDDIYAAADKFRAAILNLYNIQSDVFYNDVA